MRKSHRLDVPVGAYQFVQGVRLIDYEKFLDAKGRRLVAFGQYAGIAGEDAQVLSQPLFVRGPEGDRMVIP